MKNLISIVIIAVNCFLIISNNGITQTLAETRNEKFEELKLPRRIIAIDNVCAWPNLTLLSDSTIVATIYNQPNHGYFEGDAECWSSFDNGQTWVYTGTPTDHDPFTNRMNAAAGLNQAGDLIVLCSGWDNIKPRRNSESEPLRSSISISSDKGKTWDIGGFLPIPEEGLSHYVPFSDIIIDQNGDLVAGAYVFQVKRESTELHNREGHVYILRSKDNGKTWGDIRPVVKGTHVEAAILHLGNGRWLSASRRFGFLDLDLHLSEDDAYNWKHIGLLGIPSVSAAHLLKLSDGRILLSYGNRSPGNKGIDVRVSNDEGLTWSHPQRIIDLRESKDLGYPAALELSNGHIIISYYSSGIQEHDRYHMGIVNLHIDELVK